MKDEELCRLLRAVRDEDIDVEEALDSIRGFGSMGFACVDHDRERRRGFPEVIYCPGKSLGQILEIAERILDKHGILLATRVDDDVGEALLKKFPEAIYNDKGRVVYVKSGEQPKGKVMVISAGTSDMAVAEEAAVTAEVMGCGVERLYDVGVAGIHRLLHRGEELQKASVIIVVAGMEGALASVVGGLTRAPVIGVPTSVGYGSNFQGLSALLTMLNSCASGITVVNIDNGFGAGCAAALIINHSYEIGRCDDG